MAIDLSTASADGLKLILLKVPVKDLIKSCTQVSRKWNSILEDNDFWRNKMEEDGYLWQGKMCENGNKLEWKIFADLPTKFFKSMALKHCFERNFLKDIWNLDERNLTMDPRWKSNGILQMEEEIEDNHFAYARIEIPPKFVDANPEIPKPIEACIAISRYLWKEIVIKLADEGLTDDIMDNFRPSIVVSEIIGNRRDCDSFYSLHCSLSANNDNKDLFNQFRTDDDPTAQPRNEFRHEYRDENGSWVGAKIGKKFQKFEAEDWHRMEYKFKDYPAGMRFLTLRCLGFGHPQNPHNHYGLKMANCSVKALCEKNAPE